jgi:predicted ATPase
VLGEVFWRDADESSQQASLRVALSHIRRVTEQATGLQPRSVICDGGYGEGAWVGLCRGNVVTDLWQFKKHVRKANRPHVTPLEMVSSMLDALNERQGFLFAGLDSYCRDLEEWRRQDFEEYLSLVERLVEALVEQSRIVEAQKWLETAANQNELYAASYYEIYPQPFIRLARFRSAFLNDPDGARQALADAFKLCHELEADSTVDEIARLQQSLQDGEVLQWPEPSKPNGVILGALTQATSPESAFHSPADIINRLDALLPPSLDAFVPTDRDNVREVTDLLLPPCAGGDTLVGDSRPFAHRLVTIRGTGEVGKTRVAKEVAKSIRKSTDCGVCFLDLANLHDALEIPSHIASRLGIRFTTPASGGDDRDDVRSAMQATIGSLAGSFRPLAGSQGADRAGLLFVLDRLEHLIESGAGEVLHGLLEAIPYSAILATSRAPIGVAGEVDYFLSPLATPKHGATKAEVDECESVRLFVARYRAGRQQFALDEGNREDVAEICRLAEGLPGIIEHFAGWAQYYSPTQVVRSLQSTQGNSGERRGRPRVAELYFPEALRSRLKLSHERSYRLLSPERQAFLCRLTVFYGGFTGHAAQSVCDEPLADRYLDYLAKYSLLRPISSASGQFRFDLPDSVREFIKTVCDKDDLRSTSDRHANYWLDHFGDKDNAFSQSWQTHFLEERPNLSAALKWFREGQPEQHLRLVTSLSYYWQQVGLFHEGLCELRGALDRSALNSTGIEPDSPIDALTELTAKAHLFAGSFAGTLGRPEDAKPHFLSALSSFRRLPGQQAMVANCLNFLGNVSRDLNDRHQACVYFQESIAKFSKSDAPRKRLTLAQYHRNLANTLKDLKRLDEAQTEYFKGLEVLVDSNRDTEVLPAESVAMQRAAILNGLGNVMLDRGDYAKAADFYNKSGTQAEHAGSAAKLDLATARHNSGVCQYLLGNFAEARRLVEEGLNIRRNLKEQFYLASSHYILAKVLRHEGKRAESIRELREALQLQIDRESETYAVNSLEEAALYLAEEGYIQAASFVLGYTENFRLCGCPPNEAASEADRQAFLKLLDAVRCSDDSAIASEFDQGARAELHVVLKRALACVSIY